MGLFVDKDDKIRLSPPFNKIPIDGDIEFAAFRHSVRRLALSEGNNADFMKPKPAGAADFTFVAAWLASLDVFGDHCNDLKSITNIEMEHIQPIGSEADRYALQNDTRWAGFRDWATFLGVGYSTGTFRFDPTQAVRDELEAVFGTKRELNVNDFVGRVCRAIPILDGGEYFVQARKRSRSAWRPITDREISPALTLALLRLSDAGLLKYEMRSDAASRAMLGVRFTEIEKVSHIVLLGDVT